jgi:hypothetical protein
MRRNDGKENTKIISRNGKLGSTSRTPVRVFPVRFDQTPTEVIKSVKRRFLSEGELTLTALEGAILIAVDACHLLVRNHDGCIESLKTYAVEEPSIKVPNKTNIRSRVEICLSRRIAEKDDR